MQSHALVLNRGPKEGDDGLDSHYVKFIEESWKGPPVEIPELPSPGVPFAFTELEQVIATIPSTKAVAPGFSPGRLVEVSIFLHCRMAI